MDKFFKSIIVTFSMFSKIPMPYFEWSKEHMKYIMLIFPFVGLIVGILNLFIFLSLHFFGFSNLFLSTLLVIIPIVITGGIHLDGYLDTLDALSSHQEKSKKLEILSDPHIGAFGVLALFCYLILFILIINEISITEEVHIFIVVIPFISRCFSAFGVVIINTAKNISLVNSFKNNSNKKIILYAISILLTIAVTLLFFINVYFVITILIFNAIIYLNWYRMIKKEFGGITGDLSGYLTQKLEFYMFLAILIVQKIGVVL